MALGKSWISRWRALRVWEDDVVEHARCWRWEAPSKFRQSRNVSPFRHRGGRVIRLWLRRRRWRLKENSGEGCCCCCMCFLVLLGECFLLLIVPKHQGCGQAGSNSLFFCASRLCGAVIKPGNSKFCGSGPVPVPY